MNPTTTIAEREEVRTAVQALREKYRADVQLQEGLTRLLALEEGLATQLQAALAELAELKRQVFGEKADRLSPEQEAALAAVQEDLTEQARREAPVSRDVLEDQDQDPEKRPTRARRRHPLPEHLERETVVLEPAQVQACPQCGGTLGCIGEEVTEELDYRPARLMVRRTVRRKYACRCGGGGVQIAPLPPRLLPQSKLGLALAVHLILGRYDDHVTYYTMERLFRERHGVVIPRQQMVQWVAQVAALLKPLWLLMFREMKQGGYLQIDETVVKVLDPELKGKSARGWLWFYAVPGADVWLEFHSSRGQAAPHARLEGFAGTIQTDAYEVYEALRKRMPGLRRLGCLAHSRRRFYVAAREGSPEALWFIGQIRLLYRIEREAKQLTPEGRHQRRQEGAPPIWQALQERAQSLQPALLPQSSLGKAVNYFLKEYKALRGYLESGTFEIDNNLVENSIRSPVVGRKRWLFIGHPEAGWRSAVIYSFIISCRRRGINPQEYLTDVLSRLPAMNITQIGELLPSRWKRASTGPP
jgi:transposase